MSKLLIGFFAFGGALVACLDTLRAAPRSPKANVLIFTTTDCPIANAMLPEIMRISKDFTDKGIDFSLVHVDPDTTVAKAREHAKEYGISIPVRLDPDHKLVKQYKATRTPEAFVVLRDGSVAYHGRINNLYHAPGQRRRAPTTHELRDALNAVLTGAEIANRSVPAVGCVIADFAR